MDVSGKHEWNAENPFADGNRFGLTQLRIREECEEVVVTRNLSG